VQGDRGPAPKTPYTATLVKLKKLATGLQKHVPCFAHSGLKTLSFLPGRYFPAFSRSTTLTTFIAGPLWLID
jgi:hypothetical protein